MKFKTGDRVIINTGGADTCGRVAFDDPPIPALKACVLVAFDSGGNPQWMDTTYLRHADPPSPFYRGKQSRGSIHD